MTISTYLENAIINHVLRNTSYTPSTPLYIALFKVSPGESGSGVEVSGSGYQRVTAPSFTVSGSEASTSSTILFPAATAHWGTIQALTINNASSSGSTLFYNTSTGGYIQGEDRPQTGVAVGIGDIFSIRSGLLKITLSGTYSAYLSEKLLDHILNNVTYTSPGLDVWAALYTTLPDKNDSGGVEVSGTGYNRLRISGSSWSAPSGGAASSQVPLTFVENASDAWGTIRGICLRDASTGGNQLFRGTISPAATIIAGDSYIIEAGNLSVTLE